MITGPTAAHASRASKQNEGSCDAADSSAPVNHSEDESGNENRRRSARQRKMVNERTETLQCKQSKVAPSSAKRSGGSRSRKRHAEAVTLFDVITMGRRAMQVVIDDWTEFYRKDRDSSLLDLISCFIHCCGCQGVVTAEMCQNREDSDLLSKMVEDLDEDSGLQYKKFLAFPWILTVTWPVDTDGGEYPLTQPCPYGRWFHSEFCDFVSVLVAQCQHSIILDGYMMNTVIALLTELSDSYVRAFRHTCTLAAVKLLSALVGVAQSLGAGAENSQKLYDLQRAKTLRQKNTAQLKKMQKKITELQRKRAEIESMMDVLFKGVFLKRYCDVLPEIRSICMEELGLWMKLYSSTFLTDSYLKYVGWMMYDKTSDVRLKCVLSLQALYEDPVLLPKMDLFTSRFKERMISMTLDKDNEVAVQTLKLLLLISKTPEEVFSSEDYRTLLQCVYSSQRPLAATAGELLLSRLLNSVASTSGTQDGINDNEANKQQTFSKLKSLLEFYQESKLHGHVVYLVDSLWDCGGALLKDWPAITSILLQEPSADCQGLTEAQQAVLVEVLLASVRQASEGPPLAGRSGAKKVISAREKRVLLDDCTKLTEHLVIVLPKLLSKFSHNGEVAASLLKIPQYFHPEYPKTGNTQELLKFIPDDCVMVRVSVSKSGAYRKTLKHAISTLMVEMEAILQLHSSVDVLEASARSFLSLCEKNSSSSSAARAARDTLIEKWVNKLTQLFGNSLKDNCYSADNEQTGDILATLKKLRAFHNCHDLCQWKLFELLSPLLLVESSSTAAVSHEVLQEVLQCLCYSVLWSLSTSSETLTSRETAVAHRLQLRLFCERSLCCLSHQDTGVRQQAFLGVCDVLTAHSYQMQVWDSASFGSLMYTPSPKLQRALLTFVCTHVFVGADGYSQCSVSESQGMEKLDDLHRRRNLLAAYCKLIVHGVLEMSMAAEVLAFYTKYYNDFGDVIKETLCRTRQMDKIQCARTLALCLQQLFTRLRREQEGAGSGGPHSNVQTLTGIKELARRFALTFGEPVKFRECVVLIHRSGTDFVFQDFKQTEEEAAPPHLSYLAVLTEFSCKLLKPDKRALFSYLQKQVAELAVDLQEERWQPLACYRTSLLVPADGENAASHASSDRRGQVPGRSPSSRPRMEATKTACPNTPTEPRAARRQRSSSFSPSYQEKTPTGLDQFSTTADPLARVQNVEVSVQGAEAEDEIVDIEE